MAAVEIIQPKDDRFDGISRGDHDAAEALDPMEEAALAGGNAEAPEPDLDDDEPFTRGPAEAPAPNQHLLPQQIRKIRDQRERQSKLEALAPTAPPKPAVGKAPAKPVTAEQVSAAIAEAKGIPGPKPEQQQVAQSQPEPVAQPAPQAMRWQRPDFRSLAEQQITQARQRDPEPPRDSVVMHMEWQLREQDRRIEGARMEREMAANFDAGNRAIDHVESQEQQWRTSHPDYESRFAFVRTRRDGELQLMGYGDPAVRQRILLEEATMLTAKALSTGKNPAEVIHQLAEMWGFGRRGA